MKLIACWDRELQDNPPPLPVHVYKLFFLCRRDGGVQPPAALETLDVGWFALGALPPLSLGRVSHRQLSEPWPTTVTRPCPASSTSGGIVPASAQVSARSAASPVAPRQPAPVASPAASPRDGRPPVVPIPSGPARCGWCQNTEG